jgi:integrase
LPEIAPSYQKDYRRMSSRACEFFKTRDVRDLRKSDIINYKQALEGLGTLKAKSIKNHLDLLKTFLLYVKDEFELIEAVPAFPKISFVTPATQYFSIENQSELFQLIPESDRPIIGFLMLHGCRPSEARALRCRDIDINKLTVTISATFSGRVYRNRRKGRGALPLTVPLHHEMVEYVSERVKGNLPEAFLFVNRQGEHYSENSLTRIWAAVRIITGLSKEVRLQDFTRHSLASNLVNAGVSLFQVSKFLGHSSPKMTEKYAHANVESLRRVQMDQLTLSGHNPVQTPYNKISSIK